MNQPRRFSMWTLTLAATVSLLVPSAAALAKEVGFLFAFGEGRLDRVLDIAIDADDNLYNVD